MGYMRFRSAHRQRVTKLGERHIGPAIDSIYRVAVFISASKDGRLKLLDSPGTGLVAVSMASAKAQSKMTMPMHACVRSFMIGMTSA